MKLLKKTTADTWGTNGRALWGTYKESAWADLSLDQKNKVLTFWHKLPQDTKNTVIQAGIAFAAQAAKAPATHKKDRALNTTGDDMARLLHILFDPSLLSIKSKILKGTKTREELENKDDDPYGELAEAFNDYVTNVYVNEAVRFRADGTWYASDPKFTIIAADVYTLNPSNSDRPARDGGWVKERWRDLKNDLTAVYSRFTASGKQNGGYDEEAEWQSDVHAENWTKNYCHNATWQVVVKYAFVLLDKGSFDEVGRSLQDGIGRDDGNRGNHETKRAERKRKQRGRSDSQDTMDSADFLADTMQRASQEANCISACSALLQSDNPALKKRAEDRLAELAFRDVRADGDGRQRGRGQGRGRKGKKRDDDDDDDDDDDT